LPKQGYEQHIEENAVLVILFDYWGGGGLCAMNVVQG
jgi:hypothetical protein